MLTDKETIQLLTNWWMDFFTLDELTTKELKEIEVWNERFPDETCPIIKRREDKRNRRLSNFNQLASEAVSEGESNLVGYCVMNHDGGEAYELKLTLTKKTLTPEEKKEHFGRIIGDTEVDCMHCKHATANETGIHCTLHNKKVKGSDSCNDWNKSS